MEYVQMPKEPTKEMLVYVDEAAYIDLIRLGDQRDYLKEEVRFLLDRLSELTLDDDTYDLIRDWEGHVAPSIARLKMLLD
jgi:hypothetical protein